MKRILVVCLIVSVLVGVLGCANLSVRADAWKVDGSNTAGWKIAGDSVTGTYSEMKSHSISRNCIEDLRNFRLEMDIASDNVSSPYIRVMGMELELDANNGDGNSVFIKLNGAMLDWYGAQGTMIHLTIERKSGSELRITLQGKGNATPMNLTAPALSASSVVQIGMYRGGVVKITSFSCVATGDGSDTGPAVDSNGLVTPLTVGQHFEHGSTWTSSENKQDGLWLRNQGDGASAAVFMTEKLSDTFQIGACLQLPQQRIRMELRDKHAGSLLQVVFVRQGNQTTVQWEYYNGSRWQSIWTGELSGAQVTLRLDRKDAQNLTLTISDGTKTQSVSRSVPAEIVKRFSRVAFVGQDLQVKQFALGAERVQRDYTALASQTYGNLMKNYLDTANNRIYAVRWGFINGTVTNTGRRVSVTDAGEFWESVVMMMALDTYAQTLNPESTEYRQVAQIIANSVNAIVDGYPHKQLVTPVNAPNYAMDDCSWNVFGLYLGYYYNRVLGNNDRSNTCLRLATSLFNNSYDTYYNAELGGGLAYRESRTDVSLYGATMALAGYYIHQASGDAQVRQRYLNIYNGMEKVLRRPDGLYWCGVTATGADGIGNPYGIGEAGSVTYINGNFAMAILNALLGEEEKAEQTVLGILRYETYDNGAFMNDRDAWNNTFFLGLFVREVLAKGIAQEAGQRALESCAAMVLQNCVFEDGYYSACWSGPREPDSKGWPSVGEYKVDYSLDGRNPWGKGYNNDGLNIGSTPNQIMTSATTAHVLMAAALCDALCDWENIPAVPDVQPTDPKPTDPQPTDPQPTEPKPTEPQPTEPMPSDTKPTDSQPGETQSGQSDPTQHQPTQPDTHEQEQTAMPMWMLPVLVVAVGMVAIVVASVWKPRQKA